MMSFNKDYAKLCNVPEYLVKRLQKQKNLLISYWKHNNIITDSKVLKAFEKVPRECFVPKHLKALSYEDRPLPIGFNQTISQPTTVALMTQALNLNKGDKVLEIGTGSGYQAAIIAEIVKPGIVITTEIVKPLALKASKVLKKLGFENVKVLHHDGSLGFEKEAPYNKIIVTAAAPKILEAWIEQLGFNGVLVAPVGGLEVQTLVKVVKKETLKIYNLGEFVFVPLTGKQGWF